MSHIGNPDNTTNVIISFLNDFIPLISHISYCSLIYCDLNHFILNLLSSTSFSSIFCETSKVTNVARSRYGRRWWVVSGHYCKPTSVAVTEDTDRFFVSDGFCNSRVIKYRMRVGPGGHHQVQKVSSTSSTDWPWPRTGGRSVWRTECCVRSGDVWIKKSKF